MKIKKLKSKELLRHPTCLSPNAIYHQRYALQQGSQYRVFIGDLENNASYVVFSGLTDYQMMKLQLILVDRSSVKNVEYSRHLIRMLHLEPNVKLHDFALDICFSHQWVKDRLNLKTGINFSKICLANAYGLSRLNNPSDILQLAAERLRPAEFMPRCAAALKEERKLGKEGKQPVTIRVTGKDNKEVVTITLKTQSEAMQRAYEYIQRGWRVEKV